MLSALATATMAVLVGLTVAPTAPALASPDARAALTPAPIAAPPHHAPPSSLSEVLAALHIEPEPTDYVVLIDESGSMAKDGRYATVRHALQDMMNALHPDDHISLITFSAKATTVYQGSDTAAAMAALPPSPTGDYTDIGAAIAAGITQLDKGSSARPGVLAMITDGVIAAPATSPYRTTGTPAWKTLRDKATSLTSDREIATYAIGLGSQTDAGLLADVFPDTVIVPGDGIGKHLAAIDQEAMEFRAADKLRGDATGTVTATWGTPRHAAPNADTTTVTVTITSHLTAAPVTVSALRVLPEHGWSATLPATITLKPGQSRTFTLTVDATSSDGETLRPEATLTSPWRHAMTTLGLTFDPVWSAKPLTVPASAAARPTPAATTPTPTAEPAGPAPTAGTAAASHRTDPPTTSTPPQTMAAATPAPARGTAWWRTWMLAPVVAIVALLGLLLLRRRRDGMTGSIRIAKDGAPVAEFLLEGRSVSMAHAVGAAAPGLRGRVTPASRGADRDRVLLFGGRGGVRTTLGDGESAQVGAYTVTYTAQRTRTLHMVRAGIEPAD